MPPPKKSKPSNSQVAAKGDLLVQFTPKCPAQVEVAEMWHRSRIMFLIGAAGTGKTFSALALSLIELLKNTSEVKSTLMLTRPTVAVDEKLGFIPGELDDKMQPWIAPFKSVYDDISAAKWTKLEAAVDIKIIPIGMLRGHTIKNGIMIVDEAQDMTPAQIKCALTRLGRNSKIILCGDTDQSSLYTKKNSPLLSAAGKLDDLDTVCTVEFTKADQVRDPLVSDILDRL